MTYPNSCVTLRDDSHTRVTQSSTTHIAHKPQKEKHSHTFEEALHIDTINKATLQHIPKPNINNYAIIGGNYDTERRN